MRKAKPAYTNYSRSDTLVAVAVWQNVVSCTDIRVTLKDLSWTIK